MQGKFTTKTDVWSFGVTLWEILTFAREQPHESQSDAKILSNLSNMWREGRPTIFLSTPHGCPREVRSLLAGEYYYDVDMVNSLPNVAAQLARDMVNSLPNVAAQLARGSA